MSDTLIAPTKPRLPREIAPDIFWMGACLEYPIDAFGGTLGQVNPDATMIHSHLSVFLLRGSEKTLLVDTSMPPVWPAVSSQLDQALGDRPLDYVVPTHPEPAHAGNLVPLLEKYPDAKVLGDIRDYHLMFPSGSDLASRLEPLPVESRIELGDGMAFVLLPAVIKDLLSSQWGYEPRSGTMFVGDGFAFVHPRPLEGDHDALFHVEGECAMLSGELPKPPALEHAVFITKAALWWARYLDARPLFAEARALMKRYPTRLVAPAHGQVIDNFDEIAPYIEEAFRIVYNEGTGRGPSAPVSAA